MIIAKRNDLQGICCEEEFSGAPQSLESFAALYKFNMIRTQMSSIQLTVSRRKVHDRV